MATVPSAQSVPAERRFLLEGIPWETYLSLRESPENDHVRMTYDQGDLEIMSPSQRHEQYAYLIGRLIDVWTEEHDIDLGACRTMTFQRADLQKGLEPDNCYYLENEPVVRGKEIDLAVDPPPDLALEVETTRGWVGKLPLYAAFGVPEVWHYRRGILTILRLGADGCYAPADASGALPGFPMSEAMRLLSRLDEDDTALVRTFRKGLRP
jgi:Uma2 family endonuclease